MSSRRLIVFFIAVFLVGTLPFLVAHPSAVASAGLSLGFSAPLEHIPLLSLLMGVGILAALLPRDGLMLIPVAFALMVMVGGMVMLDIAHYPGLRFFVLGAMLCLALLVGISREKLTVLMVLIVASLGFHLGGFYMESVPTIASPLYYLLGVLLSLGLGLAISVAFGVTLIGDHEAVWERMKIAPRMQWLRKVFF